MYIIIKLLSYYCYCIILLLFSSTREGVLHDPILVLNKLISSSSYRYIILYFIIDSVFKLKLK